MRPEIDPKVDYAFKKVFGSEGNLALLLSLLNAVLKLPADQKIVSLEILNPFNDKEATYDKLSVLDIKARDQNGKQYNVEMQMVSATTFPARVLYYWAALHSRQMHEGDKYEALQPTISICFINAILFPQLPEAYHLDFQLRATQHPQVVFSEQMWLHVLELPKFRKQAEELTEPLDLWCYFLRHGAELDTANLPPTLREPALEKAMEVLEMLTKNDQEWFRYHDRLKAERDRISFINDALKSGLKQGLTEGREEGRKEGVIGRIHLCERLLKLPLTPMAALQALPLEELNGKVATLERRLGVAPE